MVLVLSSSILFWSMMTLTPSSPSESLSSSSSSSSSPPSPPPPSSIGSSPASEQNDSTQGAKGYLLWLPETPPPSAHPAPRLLLLSIPPLPPICHKWISGWYIKSKTLTFSSPPPSSPYNQLSSSAMVVHSVPISTTAPQISFDHWWAQILAKPNPILKPDQIVGWVFKMPHFSQLCTFPPPLLLNAWHAAQ